MVRLTTHQPLGGHRLHRAHYRSKRQMKAFSSPGKALLAGGYLVLDPAYSAYVVALSSRMHAVVSALSDNIQGDKVVRVRSSQFKDGEWTYVDGKMSRPNPFVQSVINVVLAYVQKNCKVSIDIYSDDAFHSQGESSIQKGRFRYHSLSLSEVPKTGMGSSAALTVSLTTALLSNFESIDLDSRDTQNKIHNLAQLAHCIAQKKVGSGFDVATAVYGSTVYQRFPASSLEQAASTVPDSEEFSRIIRELVDSQWPMNIAPCSLPPGISLIMGDVHGGSETPKMVSQVLKWRKENEQRANQVWDAINQGNKDLVAEFMRLNEHKGSSDEYEKELENSIPKMKKAIQTIRTNIRTMSHESEVPIEPESQTALLDACADIPGVVGGVVPGAGGYDAVCLVVESDKANEIIANSKKSALFDKVEWLDLKEQTRGVQEEDPTSYPSA